MSSHGDAHNGPRQHINYPRSTLEDQTQEISKNLMEERFEHLVDVQLRDEHEKRLFKKKMEQNT